MISNLLPDRGTVWVPEYGMIECRCAACREAFMVRTFVSNMFSVDRYVDCLCVTFVHPCGQSLSLSLEAPEDRPEGVLGRFRFYRNEDLF